MAKKKSRRIAAGIFFGGSAIATLGLFFVLIFASRIAAEYRARMVLYTCLAILGGLLGLIALAEMRQREQVRTWRKVISILYDQAKKGTNPDHPPLPQDDAREMEKFALCLYQKLGYRLLQREPRQGVDRLIFLVNPDGELELLQFTNPDEPASLGEVCALYEAMSRCGARRSVLWSPHGYKKEAAFWVKDKPILLADREAVAKISACLGDLALNS